LEGWISIDSFQGNHSPLYSPRSSSYCERPLDILSCWRHQRSDSLFSHRTEVLGSPVASLRRLDASVLPAVRRRSMEKQASTFFDRSPAGMQTAPSQRGAWRGLLDVSCGEASRMYFVDIVVENTKDNIITYPICCRAGSFVQLRLENACGRVSVYRTVRRV
jgi:hypothetical protein